MATVDDIEKQKKVAIEILDQKIMDVALRKNDDGLSTAESDQLDEVNDAVMKQRQAILVQAYKEALNSDEMVNALKALVAATGEMDTVACRMTTVTDFITNLAALDAAANKVVAVLKGI